LIRWSVHFPGLLVAIALLAGTQESLTTGEYRAFLYFGLIGALHAGALLISLVSRPGVLRAIPFLAVAAVLSMATPWSAFGFLWVMSLAPWLRDTVALFSMLAFSSAFGAASYWAAIRFFLWKSLAWRDLALGVALCMIATCSSFWMVGSVPVAFAQRDLLPTLAWWIAFSLSLFRSDRRQRLVVSSLQGPSSSFPPPAPQAEHVAIRASNPVHL
jgi:hypothetical protein